MMIGTTKAFPTSKRVSQALASWCGDKPAESRVGTLLNEAAMEYPEGRDALGKVREMVGASKPWADVLSNTPARIPVPVIPTTLLVYAIVDIRDEGSVLSFREWKRMTIGMIGETLEGINTSGRAVFEKGQLL